MCVEMYTWIWIRFLWVPGDSLEFCEAGVTDVFESPYMGAGNRTRVLPLWLQCVLLTTEASLQPLTSFKIHSFASLHSYMIVGH